MDVLAIIFGLAFFIYLPVAGISSVLLARRINNLGYQSVTPFAKSCWILFTVFMMICSIVITLSCFILIFNHQPPLVERLALALPVGIFFFSTLFLEIHCLSVAFALNQEDQYDLPESLRNRVTQIQAFGWIVLGLPLVLLIVFGFVPIGFLPALLALMILKAVLNIISVNRRANTAEILWLLAICIEKNISIPTELDTYSYTQPRKYRNKIQKLSSLLYSGESLSDALAATPGLVPQSVIITTRIGEKSNSLGIALRDAAIQTTKDLKHETDKSSLPNLILYIAFVVSIQFLILSFIMYWIIPKFKKIFLDFGRELPSMTHALINSSDYVINYFYLFIPLFSLPIIALGMIIFGNFYGWYNIRVPFITSWFPRLNTPHCLRHIAQSILVEKPPQIAIHSVSKFHLWTDVRLRAQSINEKVNQGENIWVSLQNDKVITSAEAALCVAAERMGNLPHILRTLADTIEQRRARRLRYLSELLKPILISILGIIVGLVVISLFLPLIQLLNDLS